MDLLTYLLTRDIIQLKNSVTDGKPRLLHNLLLPSSWTEPYYIAWIVTQQWPTGSQTDNLSIANVSPYWNSYAQPPG